MKTVLYSLKWSASKCMEDIIKRIPTFIRPFEWEFQHFLCGRTSYLIIFCFELPVFELLYYSVCIHAMNAHHTLSSYSYKISPPSHTDKIGPHKFCFLKAFSLRIGIMAFALKKNPLPVFENAHALGTPSSLSSSRGKSPKEH